MKTKIKRKHKIEIVKEQVIDEQKVYWIMVDDVLISGVGATKRDAIKVAKHHLRMQKKVKK